MGNLFQKKKIKKEERILEQNEFDEILYDNFEKQYNKLVRLMSEDAKDNTTNNTTHSCFEKNNK